MILLRNSCLEDLITFLETKWCNFIKYCDVGQNIFTTLVYLDWLAVWTMLLARTGDFTERVGCFRLAFITNFLD